MTELAEPAAPASIAMPDPTRPTPAFPPRLTLADATRARNAWIEIDLDALDHNLAALRGAIGPGSETIVVVKGNAYGAGIEGVAPALEAAGVERFAVAWVSEAVQLRELGIRRPVIVLGHAFPEDAGAALAHDLTLTCHSLALGRAMSAAAVRAGRTARIHIHIDSGLHRDGVSLEEGVALAEALRGLPALEIEGISTHMANADEPDDSFSDAQAALFRDATGRLPWIPYRHTANSATALRRTGLRFEGVRIGLALHGVLPSNTPGPALRPILSVKARLARVSTIAPGEGVSYGLTWRASRESRAALVPVGYADGWSRHLGNCGEVLIGGRRCPMVGRVMMDQFVADVTDLPGALEGDEAVLLGSQGSERITANDVATAAGTIPWDTFAALTGRLPRIFHRQGVVERITGG
ncbi:MAG: alanine racemase [Dehalococcoidia bacterium]